MRDGSEKLGETVSDAAGSWSLEGKKPEKPGKRVLVLEQLDQTGQVVASSKLEYFRPPDPFVTIEAVELESDVLYIAGKSNPRSLINLYLNGNFLAQATTGKQGRWLIEAEKKLEVGDHRFRADEINQSGAVLSRAEVPFEREAAEPIVQAVSTSGNNETEETVIIRGGDNLWRIARRLYGRGIRYTTIYQANQRQIRDPDLIFPGQIFVIPSDEAN